jgi:hypothetical protein
MGRQTCLVAGLALLTALALSSDGATAPTLITPTVDMPDYFPLQVGNRWDYGGPAGVFTATVTGNVLAADGRRYFTLDGYRSPFDPTRLVSATRRNRITEFNPDGLNPNLWYLLGAPVGTSWTIRIQPPLGPLDECVNGSTVTVGSRTEEVIVRAGTFRGVVRLDIANHCFDFGTVAEWFAPEVGLIKREDVTFSGTAVTELIRAEVGDLTLPAPRYSAHLSLERPDYVNNLTPPIGPGSLPVIRGSFKLVNRTGFPLELDFPGCKSVSIVVRNGAGAELVHARGDDGSCCPACTAVKHLSLTDGILVLPFTFRLQLPGGSPLPPGRYSVDATLMTLDPPPLRSSASAMIDVRSIH